MTDKDDKNSDATSGADATDNRPASAEVTHFPAAARAKACPICGKPVTLEARPFCSKRCADIDLGRWLGEAYRIPAVENEETEDSPDGASGDGDPGRG